MNADEIKQGILKYVEDNTFTNKNSITEDSLIFKEGYLDSMGLVMLITFLENTFSISVNDADMVEENFESINAISQFVLKKAS